MMRAPLTPRILAIVVALVCSPALLGDPPESSEDLTPREIAAAMASGRDLDDETLERLVRLHHSEVEEVRLVLVPTSVEDRRGRRVRGLAEDDFLVWEDHLRQNIEYFSVETQEPVAIAFLLDVSGSMRQVGKLEAAKEAIRHFVDGLRFRDRFALICFADEQVAWVTNFTSDRELFLKRLSVQDGYGQTALNDAVAQTPHLVFEDEIELKKAIVLITDGIDTNSELTTEQAIEAARRVAVPIYTIGFSALPEYVMRKGETAYNLGVLDRFSEETGGKLFVAYDPAELKEAVLEIEDELRFQYVIGYYPQRALDGEFRAITVETRSTRHTVRSRKGYYATP
jgi:Ca-activated chloride channel family protein